MHPMNTERRFWSQLYCKSHFPAQKWCVEVGRKDLMEWGEWNFMENSVYAPQKPEGGLSSDSHLGNLEDQVGKEQC